MIATKQNIFLQNSWFYYFPLHFRPSMCTHFGFNHWCFPLSPIDILANISTTEMFCDSISAFLYIETLLKAELSTGICENKKRTFSMWSNARRKAQNFLKNAIKLRQNGQNFSALSPLNCLVSFPVAEAYGMIYHRPSGENSSFFPLPTITFDRSGLLE